MLIATMLAIAVVWPVQGRNGDEIWPIVLVLALYNLIVHLVRARVPRLSGYRWVALADLPVATVLAILDTEPGGPLFVAFVLAVVTAATALGPREMVAYVGAAVVAIATVAATLPGWSSDPVALRQLAARTVVLAVIGLGTVVLVQRLAREQARARALRQEANRLEAVDRARSTFLAGVSHDLRTPLTAARAGIGMLGASAGDRLTPEEMDLLENASRGVERLGRAIDDLLVFNQLVAGTLRLKREPLDLRDVLVAAVNVVRPLAQAGGQTVEIELPSPLPVVGDRNGLERAIINLVGNAVRHSGSGTHIATTGDVSGEVVGVTIVNSGPNLAEGDIDRLLETLGRPRLAGDDAEMVGMGLSIARAFVGLHGGRLWAERVARGVAVRVELPHRPIRRDEPWSMS